MEESKSGSGDSQVESTENKAFTSPQSTKDEKLDLEELLKNAEEGCENSQVTLGLYLLKLAESGIEKERNSVESLKWLIESSKQGNELATSKIRHCLETDMGITDQNKDEIIWCLNTSNAEKKVRHASKKLFTVLNPNQTNLSQEQYLEAINQLPVLDERQRKLMAAAVKKIGSTVTENEFVKILSSKIQGTLTLSSSEVGDTSADYQSSSYVRRTLVYPKQTASDLLDQGLEFASKRGMALIMSVIPTGQIYLLISIFLYSFLTLSFVVLVVPLISFYISAAVMIIATLQMFYKRRKQKDSDNLASMLQQFDTGLDLQSTASQYSWNSLTPYLVFFSSLFIMVLSFSLSKKDYIPCGGLFVVSLIMTGFCFYALSDTHDIITLATLVAHFFASLPVYLASLPSIPGIKYIYTRFLEITVGGGFSLNVSFPSLVYMVIPFLLFRMAMKDSWTGIYKIVIPHLVCYFWFSISTTVFPYTTVFEIVKAGVIYSFLPLLAPILTILGIIYLFYQLLLTDVFGKIAIMAILLSVPLVLAKYEVFLGGKGKKLSPQMKKVKKYTMIGFAVLAVVPLLFIHTSVVSQPKIVEIEWNDYKELCIPKIGEITAPYQLRCRPFVGLKAHWRGVVEQVQISDVDNTVESVVKAMPSFMSMPLRCFYGQPLPDCDEAAMARKEFKRCQILKDSGRNCHLEEYNQLSFSLSVKVDNDVTVQLNAGASFKSKLMALAPGDEVEFTGILKGVGSRSPVLSMKSLNCSSRSLPEMTELAALDEDGVYELIQEAVAVTVNFIFFPVISYTAE